MKSQIYKEIETRKIIAILRGLTPEQSLKVANALFEGGITLLEVAFDQREKENGYRSTLDSIRRIAEQNRSGTFVGAGTVMNREQVNMAREAGAGFIISPDVNKDVIQLTGEYGMVSIPGAYTATEINYAYSCGADYVKIFPASAAGPSYFKAIREPLGFIPILAVGGVNEENITDFLKAGAVGVGMGGNLVNKELIARGQYHMLTQNARKIVTKIADYRLSI